MNYRLAVCIVSSSLLVSLPFAWAKKNKVHSIEPKSVLTQVTPNYVKAIDKKADPCEDFFQYACGEWNKNNPIPAEQSRWGTFSQLADNTLNNLRAILETKSAAPSASDKQMSDYYDSCMDMTVRDGAGIKPLQGILADIDSLTGLNQLPRLMAGLHLKGVRSLFSFGSGQDFKDAKQVIAHLDQGGLGLPDRDYYFKDDSKSKELRQKYVAHIQKIFELTGTPAAQAQSIASQVFAFETALAKESMDKISRRDPAKLFRPAKVEQLVQQSPSFDWKAYFLALGIPSLQSLNLVSPDFIKSLSVVLKNQSLESVKLYLKWSVINGLSGMLSQNFVDASFEFYGKTLKGAKQIQPQWKRCVHLIDGSLGDALAQKYVVQYFPQTSKTRMLEMISYLRQSLQKDIQDLSWMGAATKIKALQKLKAIVDRIGYPDKWRDYTSVNIRKDNLIANIFGASEFETKRDLNKIGKSYDPNDWSQTAPTVNAYYDPQQNGINFPAGILQPPFFDAQADDAINYGAIGSVIGHELSHGFDDEGGQFDAFGNLENWWTKEDREAFEKRAQCLVDQYNNYIAVDDIKLNGKLTLGENIADNGGVRIALMAYLDAIKDKKVGIQNGFTKEQRFFLGYAQVWCGTVRDETARLFAQTDPHSPGRYRVNGVVENIPEFYRAFSCKPKKQEKDMCRVW